MKLIHKHNIFIVIACTYTIVSLSLTTYEILVNQAINPTQLNIFLFFILSVLGVCLLSQQYRLDRFSPLTIMILLYVTAILLILISLKVASYMVDIHPDGYHDLIVSFSIPYVIGVIIYHICLKLEVNKQNQLIQELKKKQVQREE